jgi:hypothetical protein
VIEAQRPVLGLAQVSGDVAPLRAALVTACDGVRAYGFPAL